MLLLAEILLILRITNYIAKCKKCSAIFFKNFHLQQAKSFSTFGIFIKDHLNAELAQEFPPRSTLSAVCIHLPFMVVTLDFTFIWLNLLP